MRVDDEAGRCPTDVAMATGWTMKYEWMGVTLQFDSLMGLYYGASSDGYPAWRSLTFSSRLTGRRIIKDSSDGTAGGGGGRGALGLIWSSPVLAPFDCMQINSWPLRRAVVGTVFARFDIVRDYVTSVSKCAVDTRQLISVESSRTAWVVSVVRWWRTHWVVGQLWRAPTASVGGE